MPEHSDTVQTHTRTLGQWLREATAHYNAGRLPEADTICRQVLEQRPGHPHCLHLLGLIAFQNDRNDDAVKLLEQAIAKRGDRPEYHANLGLVLRKQCHRALQMPPPMGASNAARVRVFTSTPLCGR